MYVRHRTDFVSNPLYAQVEFPLVYSPHSLSSLCLLLLLHQPVDLFHYRFELLIEVLVVATHEV